MSDQTLPDWVATVCLAMDVDPQAVDIPAVLDLAKDAAHGVARPAAPLTTFLAGYVAGREDARSGAGAGAGSGAGAATREALAQVGRLVPAPPGLDQQPPSTP